MRVIVAAARIGLVSDAMRKHRVPPHRRTTVEGPSADLGNPNVVLTGDEKDHARQATLFHPGCHRAAQCLERGL
jgi:hypothetical protein